LADGPFETSPRIFKCSVASRRDSPFDQKPTVRLRELSFRNVSVHVRGSLRTDRPVLVRGEVKSRGGCSDPGEQTQEKSEAVHGKMVL
jgi:hypothetical protein